MYQTRGTGLICPWSRHRSKTHRTSKPVRLIVRYFSKALHIIWLELCNKHPTKGSYARARRLTWTTSTCILFTTHRKAEYFSTQPVQCKLTQFRLDYQMWISRNFFLKWTYNRPFVWDNIELFRLHLLRFNRHTLRFRLQSLLQFCEPNGQCALQQIMGNRCLWLYRIRKFVHENDKDGLEYSLECPNKSK